MNEKGYYEQTDAQFKIRLPHELKEKIRQSAEQYNRTMTADIVARLEQTFSNSVNFDDIPLELLISKISDRLAGVGLHMELYSRDPNSTVLPSYKKPTA